MILQSYICVYIIHTGAVESSFQSLYLFLVTGDCRSPSDEISSDDISRMRFVIITILLYKDYFDNQYIFCLQYCL